LKLEFLFPISKPLLPNLSLLLLELLVSLHIHRLLFDFPWIYIYFLNLVFTGTRLYHIQYTFIFLYYILMYLSINFTFLLFTPELYDTYIYVVSYCQRYVMMTIVNCCLECALAAVYELWIGQCIIAVIIL